MAHFSYRARDEQGLTKTGSLEAANKASVLSHLRDRHLMPLQVKEEKKGLLASLNLGKMMGVPMKDKVVFTRQLASIINAGITLVEALKLIQDQTSNAKFKEIIGQVLNDIQSGTTFGDALVKHPDTFSDLFVNIVRAGEVSGTLDTSLEGLATQMQKDAEIMGKIKGAMVLPGLVLAVIVGVVILMSVAVIPQLSDMFKEAGASLPLPTKIMMAMSDFFIKLWWLAILMTIGTAVGMVKFFSTKQGKNLSDHAIFKIPVFGKLQMLVTYARITHVLSMLLTSGVPLLKSMEIVADLAGNVLFTDSIKRIAKRVEQGVPLSTSMAEEPLFPAMMHQMLSIGEQTGGVDNMLNRLAQIYDTEVNNIVKNLTTLMEPMLMMIMGGAVAFIVMAVLMPIYNLVNVIE